MMLEEVAERIEERRRPMKHWNLRSEPAWRPSSAQPPRGAQRLQRRGDRRADGRASPSSTIAPTCAASCWRPRQGLLSPAPTCRGCAHGRLQLGARTAPTHRRWPTCCTRSTAARCRWSGASTATSMPVAWAWPRCATCWWRPTRPPSA